MKVKGLGNMYKRFTRKVSLILCFILIISNIGCTRASTSNGLQLIENNYSGVPTPQVQYKDGKIQSPVYPYSDFYSLFTKLPLGHTAATGKGVNIGVIGEDNEQLASFVYYTAINSKVYRLNDFSTDGLKRNSIHIVAIDDITGYDQGELTKYVEYCIKNDISIVIQGDISEKDSDIDTVNKLEKLGAIVVGQIQRQGVTYAFINDGTKAFNNKLKNININIFAPNIYSTEEEKYEYSLYGVSGALALVVENKKINGKKLKDYLLTHSRNVWQSYSIDGKTYYHDSIETNNLTSEMKPKGNNIYKFRQLDLELLLDVKINGTWNSNIYNLSQAWEISKGNVDVAIIDQGFYPQNPYIKNNVVEAIQFGKWPFNENFHGTSMAHALLNIAPEARLHLLLADVFSEEVRYKPDNIIKAIDYCITKKIPIISMSWAGFFGKEKALVDKINEARDKGITIIWFWYPQPEKEDGIIGPFFTYFSMGDNIAALDRFVADSMYYPQEMQAGLSCTAPQVAGLAAIIKAKYPNITPKEIENCLKDNSTTLPGGAMVPDMYKVLNSLSDKD